MAGCGAPPAGARQAWVKDARRVADVVGDHVGYPAPRLALRGVVFPQAGEAPPALAALFGASM